MGTWTSSHWAHLMGINGRGSVARKLVKIIEELTNASFLSKLTLLPVAHCLSDQGLLTDKKRWCPHCIYDCMSAGGAYGLLLWQIKLVTVCPLHEIPLVSSCDCKGALTPVGTRAKHLPYVCHKCGAILGHNKRPFKDQADQKEISIARQISDFLASDIFQVNYCASDLNGVPNFLKEVARVYMEGNAASLARHLGVGKSTLHGWVHGPLLPSLWTVLGIAETFGCTIRDVLVGNIESTVLQGRLRLSVPRQYKVKTTEEWAAVREQLRGPRESSGDSVPSIESIARANSVDRRSIFAKFPEESAALVSRRARWIRIMKEQNQQKRTALIRTVAAQLVTNGIYPSRRKIESCLRGDFAIFTPELKDVCKEARENALNKPALEGGLFV